MATQRPEFKLFADHVLLGLGLKRSKLFVVHFVSSMEGWRTFAFGKQLHEVSKKIVLLCSSGKITASEFGTK